MKIRQRLFDEVLVLEPAVRTDICVSRIIAKPGTRDLKSSWNTSSIRKPPLRSSHLSSELKSEQTEVSRLKAVSPSRNSSSGLEGSVLSERPGSSLNGSSVAWQQTQFNLLPESNRVKSVLHSGIRSRRDLLKKQPDFQSLCLFC